MKLPRFLLITAIIYIPFGIAMALVPAFLYGFYGFDLGTDGLILGRVVGAAIIGMGIINFMARKGLESSGVMKAILSGNLVYHLLEMGLMPI